MSDKIEHEFIEISKKLRKWIRTIPQSILDELWEITQDFDYIYDEDGSIKWRTIDELTQEISYARREGNNPDDYEVKEMSEKEDLKWKIKRKIHDFLIMGRCPFCYSPTRARKMKKYIKEVFAEGFAFWICKKCYKMERLNERLKKFVK